MKIKKINGEIIFKANVDNIKDAVEEAVMRGADLRGANLRGADLRYANIRGAISIPYIPLACPSDGEFTGWKKVGDKLIRLLIPADAKRSSAASKKCRCDKAKVVAITSLDEGECYEEVYLFNIIGIIACRMCSRKRCFSF